jgi:hypothetical protein
VLNELDNVATDIAAATVEDLLLGVDSESIVATALRARPDEFCGITLPCELDTAAIDLAFDRHGASAFYPILELSVPVHGAISV